MNGYEVCKRLKTDPDAWRGSIIFVTAHAGTESEVRALECGAVDFITKPLNPAVVRARVNTHLKLLRQAAAMAHLANRDGLTGLFNRRYFDDVLEREFQRHRRQGLSLALAFIDIDFFKPYNDCYGHQEGDVCLQRVAREIGAGTSRPGEIVARYGGEEFVTLLPYTVLSEALKYGDWLCEKIRAMGIAHAGSTCSDIVTISVGVAALVPVTGIGVRQLFDGADQALYLAKSAGRNQSAKCIGN